MNDLISKIKAYTGGAISRDEFSLWFFTFAREIEREYSSGPLLEMVFEIEGILAESSSGGWSEADLIDELESVAVPEPVAQAGK